MNKKDVDIGAKLLWFGLVNSSFCVGDSRSLWIDYIDLIEYMLARIGFILQIRTTAYCFLRYQVLFVCGVDRWNTKGEIAF